MACTPAKGHELVETGKARDVADLRNERRGRRQTDAGDGAQPPRELAVKELSHPSLGALDLALEQLVLLDEQRHLEGDLLFELAHGDRLARGGVDGRGCLRPEGTLAKSLVGTRERRHLASCGLARGGRDPQEGDGRLAGRLVEGVMQLGEAEIHEAHDAVAHPRLLFHEAPGEAGGLAKFGVGEWLSGLGSVDHA